jgi:hypothetical protein
VPLEGLGIEDALFVSRGHEKTLLFFGEDSPGENGVYADVGGSEVMREGASHAHDGSLGDVVDGEVGRGDDPCDGTHIDDGAAARCFHAGCDGLSGEKLMAEVHCNPLVPGVGGYVFEFVAVVASGVVDEDLWRAQAGS